MEINKYSISGLYYKYKNCSDDEIRKVLEKVKVVLYNGLVDDKYYPLSKEAMAKITAKPRGASLSFDVFENKQLEALEGEYEEYMRFAFLVKSTSRFFLKPDIGEIIDQIPFMELLHIKFDVISMEYDYNTLPDTDGEHHIMTATLLTKKK